MVNEFHAPPSTQPAREDLPQASTLEERRSQLFNTYIQRMFRRPTRTGGQTPYSDEQTIS
jgi:hypothetical protein